MRYAQLVDRIAGEATDAGICTSSLARPRTRRGRHRPDHRRSGLLDAVCVHRGRHRRVTCRRHALLRHGWAAKAACRNRPPVQPACWRSCARGERRRHGRRPERALWRCPLHCPGRRRGHRPRPDLSDLRCGHSRHRCQARPVAAASIAEFPRRSRGAGRRPPHAPHACDFLCLAEQSDRRRTGPRGGRGALPASPRRTICGSSPTRSMLICFERPHVSIASIPGMLERTVTVSSLSKSHAMTGWRSGCRRSDPPISPAT